MTSENYTLEIPLSHHGEHFQVFCDSAKNSGETPTTTYTDSFGNSQGMLGANPATHTETLTSYQPKSGDWFRITVDNGTGYGAYIRIGYIRCTTHLTQFHSDGSSNFLSEGETYTVRIATVGGPDGTPTYLETLDKLDQWSSAHYIPDSRNKLNL